MITEIAWNRQTDRILSRLICWINWPICSCINNKSQYFIVYFIWFYSVPKNCFFWKSTTELKTLFQEQAPCPFEILVETLTKPLRHFLKEWKQNRPWLVSQTTFGDLLFLLRFFLLLLLLFLFLLFSFLSVHHELVHGRSQELQDRISWNLVEL